jgi:hypothetical protein
MNDEIVSTWKKIMVPEPYNLHDRLRKTTEKFSQDCFYPGPAVSECWRVRSLMLRQPARH